MDTEARAVRRSRAALRAAIVLAAAGASLAVVRAGMTSWLRDSNPILAAQIAPGDARSAVAAARAMLGNRDDVQAPTVRSLVDAALNREVALPGAIELRALQAETAGDGDRAERLFTLSNAISRRSLPTRLWWIQRSVDRGDVAGALNNFDIALRTSTDAPAILFPILAGATSDPALTAPIARMLDRPSDWRIMFLHHAITQDGAARNIAAVALKMRDRQALSQIGQLLIGQLVNEGAFVRAREVSDALQPSRRLAGLVSDPNFSRPDQRFPFGWNLSGRGEAWAARELVGGHPALAFQAPSSRDGPVATQLLTLAPGNYRLVTKAAATAGDPTAPPLWTLTCGEAGGPQIARLNQPIASGSAAATNFTVPSGCGGQWLALNLRASDAPDGQSGAVAMVFVERR